eukprot:TRINITY_DN131_c0_g1_i1.p1 TRINITY_DN131_c0_g1~~TRINITY_DN131_c0_g1_i1.p1  ORF type:complete len:326 (-),score=87.47 TRINITY_DN131_c0_g1_i1:106-1083(-)
MQTQIHVKVTCNEEHRRFLLGEKSFQALTDKIRNLFNFDGASFVTKYQDDEGDWVTVTSDTELEFALQLFGSKLLRLCVSRCTNVDEIKASDDVEDHIEERAEKKERVRPSLGQKREKIAARIEEIKSEMVALAERPVKNPDRRAHIVSKMQQRLSMLEEKLKFISDKLSSDQTPTGTVESQPAPPSNISTEDVKAIKKAKRAELETHRLSIQAARAAFQLAKSELKKAYTSSDPLQKKMIPELEDNVRKAKEEFMAQRDALRTACGKNRDQPRNERQHCDDADDEEEGIRRHRRGPGGRRGGRGMMMTAKFGGRHRHHHHDDSH